jgi:hypothetical protein
MLAQLNPQVAEWIKASPALKKQLERLADDGLFFDTGPTQSDKAIPISAFGTNPRGQFQEVVSAAADRVYPRTPYPEATLDNRDEYTRQFVDAVLTEDGARMFNQVAVWAENPDGNLHRPQDPSGNPMTPAEFAAGRRIYGQWVAGSISTEAAIRQMGELRARQPSPDPEFRTQREYWEDMASNRWDNESAGRLPDPPAATK